MLYIIDTENLFWTPADFSAVGIIDGVLSVNGSPVSDLIGPHFNWPNPLPLPQPQFLYGIKFSYAPALATGDILTLELTYEDSGGSSNASFIGSITLPENPWIPQDSFTPPVGWHWGDPPPSPWVDGDPVPDGWTPPDGYVPADTCTYGITPEEVIVPYVAGSVVVDINASGPDCAWTTLPNDGWIFGTYSGTGIQTREISWSENLTIATRIGTVTMAGLTFMVIQLPPPPPDNISIQTGCHGASVTLTWDAMPSAVGYNIYRDGSLIASVSALTQTYTDTGVLIGTRYSYQIETRYPSSVVGTRSDRYFKTPCTTCPVDDLSDWQSLCAVDTKYSPVVSAWEETCGSEQRWVQKSIPAPIFKEKVVSP